MLHICLQLISCSKARIQTSCQASGSWHRTPLPRTLSHCEFLQGGNLSGSLLNPQLLKQGLAHSRHWINIYLFILKQFSHSQEVGEEYRKFFCIFHPAFPNNNILCNHSTLSKPGYWHWSHAIRSDPDLFGFMEDFEQRRGHGPLCFLTPERPSCAKSWAWVPNTRRIKKDPECPVWC